MGRGPRDIARIAVGAVLTAGLAVAAASTDLTRAESDIFRVFNRLPDEAGIVLLPALIAGTAAAIGLASGIALFLRRVRLGAALAISGTLAWLSIRLIDLSISRPGPAQALSDAIVRRSGSDFPSSAVAVITALAVVTVPYLPGAARRAVWVVVAVVAGATMFAGTALPLGVAVGALVGLWAGSTTTLLVGAPGRGVSAALLRAVLERADVRVESVEQVSGRRWGDVGFTVRTSGGRELAARVLRRLPRRMSLAYQVRRYLASLELLDEEDLASPRHRVEHEAYLHLLAERAGTRVPDLVLARELPGRAAVIVTERLEATPLSQTDAVEDRVLDEVWEQVELLHTARIAHHGLWDGGVVLDADGRPWLTRFDHARAAAGREALLQDVAELLAGMSTGVGAERAVASAVRVLGAGRVSDSLTYLHPLALPRRVRSALGDQPDVLAGVREAAAQATGVEPPDTRLRIRPSTVLGLLVAGGAIYVLLPQIGSFERLLASVRDAQPGWLAVAFVSGLLTTVAAGVSYWGSAHRSLPLLRTSAVQLAAMFTGRLTPGGIGGIGLNLVYLEHQGFSRKEAVSAAALNTAGGAVAHAALFFAAVGVLGLGQLQRGLEVPTGWPVLVAILVVLLVLGIALASPIVRRRVLLPVRDVGRTLLETLRHPLRASALFGGSTAVTLFNAVAFLASIYAFGGGVPVVQTVAVYVGGTAIASAAPTPGGLGAVEAALVAGMTGIGMASEPAVAAVLSFRLLTFWLPILPGMATYRLLQHRGQV